MNKFKNIFSHDDSFNRRKVENSEEIILAAKHHGLTYDDIAKLCDISKTMISHWGSNIRQERPTYSQIEPLLKEIGMGRIKVHLEASPAAILYNDRVTGLITLVIFMFAISSLWFFSWKPCSDNWSQCKKLKWYEMPIYESINLKKDIQEFNEFRLLQNTK